MILLDTDHLSILINAKAAKHRELDERLRSSNDKTIAASIVSLEEQCRGWLAQINRLPKIHDQIHAYERLRNLFHYYGEWEIVPFDADAADTFNRLRKQKVRIGTQDLKISAIALVNDALLLSANLRDFKKVPGLRVENWLE
jgi:tRNA(fMet)-specific endonuclease VapC